MSEDLEPWQRDHEPGTPVADVRQLQGDLLTQVPRHDHDVVRTLLVQPLARPVSGELMLNAFLGILVGDAVGLGVELVELVKPGGLP